MLTLTSSETAATYTMKRSCGITLLFSAAAIASPIPSLESWLSDVLPSKPGSSSVQAELQCYGLPYGAIGFVSHILTYWAVLLIASKRRPLMPWKKLEHNVLDLILSSGSVIVSVLLAVLTIVRCRNSWQFLVIAVWKTTLSFTLGMVGLHRAFQITQHKGKGFSAWWWLFVYLGGTIAGLTGVLSLVGDTFTSFPAVRTITYVFVAVAVATGVAIFLHGLYLAFFNNKNGYKPIDMMAETSVVAFLAPMLVFGLLGAFYSDWILAAVADNGWAGQPSDDNRWLYWTYFVAKRIPLFAS